MTEETRNLLIMTFTANIQRAQSRFRNQDKLQKKIISYLNM